MHELEGMERRGWEALSGSNGAAFYEEHMADDGLMLFPGGLILDKPGAVEAIAAAAPWDSFELVDLRTVEASRDSAVVTYRATARREGVAYRALMTTVYARRAGRWHVVLHQQTPY